MISDLTITRLRKMAALARDPIGRRSFLRQRVVPAYEHRPVLDQLGPIDRIIDVGANRGQFALAALSCWPEASVVCLEPLPSEATVLRKVLAPWGSRVTTLGVAAADEEGDRPFYVSRSADSSSLYPITEKQVAAYPSTALKVTSSVPTARLDDLVDPEPELGRTLIKVDTQGSELDVLRGASANLDAAAALILEVSFVEMYAGQPLVDAIVGGLAESGWRLASIYDVRSEPRNRRPLQADALFMPVKSPRAPDDA